jgi:hypothetical protein
MVKLSNLAFFLAEQQGHFETKLAGDGATRGNDVIRKLLGEFVLQLAAEQQKIDASLD